MNARSARWEMGSLFHLADVPGGEGVAAWADHPHALLGSGRDALRLLLRARPPKTLHVPSFMCQEVVGALVDCAPRVALYPDSPLQDVPPWAEIPVEAGDAVLAVDYFGLRVPFESTLHRRPDVTVIEDHTHDPCGLAARGSEADFCVTSLRKLWPLPDGGVLWSPRGHAVPGAPSVDPELERASGIKLAGMVLKARYLEGEPVEKPLFRALLDRGERGLYTARTSAITSWSRALLDTLPFETLERGRMERFERLIASLPDVGGYRVARPAAPRIVPFSAFFVFDRREVRDRVHQAMIDARVYASALWPLDETVLDGVPPAHRDLARRTFSLPIDMRYTLADMDRAAEVIGQALRSAR